MPKSSSGGTGLRLEDLPPKVREAFAPLSVPERKFVVAICSDCNASATLAVVAAGICRANQTYPARASKAVRINRDPRIQAAKEAWMDAYALTGTEVTARIKARADTTPFPFYEAGKDGKLKIKEKITQEEWEKYAHQVKEVRTNDEGVVVGLVLHDAFAAERELAKINHLYSDAPQFHFHAHLERLSDEELLRQLREARAEAEIAQGDAMPALPPGPPVVVIDPPKEP
jgi:hypothetical protein